MSFRGQEVDAPQDGSLRKKQNITIAILSEHYFGQEYTVENAHLLKPGLTMVTKEEYLSVVLKAGVIIETLYRSNVSFSYNSYLGYPKRDWTPYHLTRSIFLCTTKNNLARRFMSSCTGTARQLK